MTRVVHPIAGAIALLTIGTFWLSTIISELWGSPQAVVLVKTTIPWGFLLLVPALAATGGSGLTLAKGRREGTIGAKWKRMPVIAANGILVLIPSALFLASKARAGQFDTTFYGVQGLELLAGATNLTLLALSMRDGLRLTQWRRNSMLRPVPTRSTSLVSRQEVAKGTVAVHLSKPAGLEFSAGQAVYLTLPASADGDRKGRIRTFSIASAPNDPELVIATRVSDTTFKRSLMALPLGTGLQLEGPFGSLSLHEDAAKPAVFLAGGIGITPLRSIILDATQRQLPHRLVLFYSNRNSKEAAFLAELSDIANRNPRFTLVATVTDQEGGNPEWSGERGFITREMITRYVDDLRTPVFYIVGPPAMTAAMESLLRVAGVKREDMRMEAFVGY